MGNLLKQIGKHLTTIRITGRITKCKRKDAFYEKLGLFKKKMMQKKKKEAECFFLFFTKGEEMSRVGSRDRHA